MVLAEGAAALAGIAIAAAGTFVATDFDLPLADGSASIMIGCVVGAVGFVLVRESKGLLIGERAAPDLTASILALSEEQSEIEGANGVVATHLAPYQVVVALSLEFSDALRAPEVEKAVQALEVRVREKHPEVVALYVKPQSPRAFEKGVRESEARGDYAFTSAHRPKPDAGSGGGGKA